jgi:hypothetical protein
MHRVQSLHKCQRRLIAAARDPATKWDFKSRVDETSRDNDPNIGRNRTRHRKRRSGGVHFVEDEQDRDRRDNVD